MKNLLRLLVIIVFSPLITANAQEPISDNSFLVEEAYNQDAGVVQHINTFQRMRSGDWVYTFTQEWPVVSHKHQLSYTIPGLGFAEGGKGIGDLALNYRYQLISTSRIAVAPRVSLLLPFGSALKGTGAGGAGLQFNLPVSIVHSKHLVTHWNAGTTITPHAKDDVGDRASTVNYNLGQSVVWLANLRFNALFETAWSSNQAVTGPLTKVRNQSLYLNPGVRWSYNFRHSGLQIVPGVSVPVGVGASSGQRGIFMYLSLEHPFKKEK